MAIEGPLRELGIQDVFQLLDLSRKTGALRVTSELRDNEGTVFFESGKVVFAAVRSNPHPIGSLLLRSGKITESELERARALHAESKGARRLGQVLVELGAITARELEKQVRLQVEAVVFELMSWQEGFFSFEERDVSGAPADATARISTESLLMESARRIDEWSRIAYKVPSLAMIPTLAPAREDGPSLLDLLPNEWEVLTAIDGESDLRAIAASLARSDFDIAKVAYGLLSTGVVELLPPAGRAGGGVDAGPYVIQARIALSAGRGEEALGAAREALAADPASVDARLVAARALLRLGRAAEAAEELRRAAAADADHPDVQLELGYAAARRGDLEAAIAHWDRHLAANATLPATAPVRVAARAAAQLRNLLREHAGA